MVGGNGVPCERPNNAFEYGRAQAPLRSLARAVQRERYVYRWEHTL